MPSSLASRGSSAFDSLSSRRTRPIVEIKLNNEARINTYSTFDTIEGEVILSAESDVRFDQLSISFIGASRTVIERPGYAGPTAGRSSAFHTFLRLIQPIEESQYPQPRVLEAGRKYSFPFTFVVPDRLLPNSCRHNVNHRQVHAAHTHVLPSLGDPSIAGRGLKLLDDMCPHMCQIQYQIRAKLTAVNQLDAAPKTLADVGKKVRIVPASDEEPPLDVSSDSEEFCMRTEKSVKKGALRKKYGRIAVAAAQPKPFRLSPINAEDSRETAPSTMAKLHIRFDPDHEHQKPPQLGSLWTKLKINTFYSVEPVSDFPSQSSKLIWNQNKGVYTDTVSLACRCVASAQWEKHSSSPSPSPSSTPSCSRRCSIQSSSTTSSIHSLPGPTASSNPATPYYTATILIPISLPTQKSYPPTFHSCLISRTYALDISLSFSPSKPNTFTTRQTVGLRIPVQVTSAQSLAAVVVARMAESVGNAIAAPGGTTESMAGAAVTAAVEDAEIVIEEGRDGDGGEFFTPRVITPPPAEYVQQARLSGVGLPATGAPPDYANVSSRRVGVASAF